MPVRDGSIDEYIDEYSLFPDASVLQDCPDIRVYSEHVYSAWCFIHLRILVQPRDLGQDRNYHTTEYRRSLSRHASGGEMENNAE